MKKFLFLAFVAFALCSCGDSSNAIDEITDNTTDDTHNDEQIQYVENEVSNYFIQKYLIPSEIEVKCVEGILYLDVRGYKYYTFKGHPTFEKAKEFAEFYGDTFFNRAIIPGGKSCLAYPINKITICCDKEFDAEHPKGRPLDDIVNLEFETVYEYIKNGYRLPAEIPNENRRGNDTVAHLLCFKNITAEVATLVNIFPFNGQMINVTPLIYFASQPETSGEYTFTLEMIINGETFKTEFSYTFE